MIHPPQKQEVEEQKMGGNGGGGKPFIRFGGASTFSSTVCRPDPEHPGHQICKKVVKEEVIDPETGKKTTREVESEDSQPSGFLGYMRPGGSADYDKRPIDVLRDKGRIAVDKFKNLMHFGEGNQAPLNSYQHHQPEHHPHFYAFGMPTGFGPLGMFGMSFQHNDPFFPGEREWNTQEDIFDQLEREFFGGNFGYSVGFGAP